MDVSAICSAVGFFNASLPLKAGGVGDGVAAGVGEGDGVGRTASCPKAKTAAVTARITAQKERLRDKCTKYKLLEVIRSEQSVIVT